MLGTVVNALAIIAGGVAGMLAGAGLPVRIRTIKNQAVGMAVVFVGASGCIAQMLKPEANPVLFIVSLALGGVIGELAGIEAALERLGVWLQGRVQKMGSKSNISGGFVAASLIFCVGTMAILGSLESGVNGRHTILFAKSLLDGIIALVMASTMGLGVVFSAVSVFVYQGILTMLAVWVSPWLTPDMLREMSVVGGILIAGIGLNMLEITKLRVGNMLPALFLPPVWYLLVSLFQ